jgi:hypothetical protein
VYENFVSLPDLITQVKFFEFFPWPVEEVPQVNQFDGTVSVNNSELIAELVKVEVDHFGTAIVMLVFCGLVSGNDFHVQVIDLDRLCVLV